MSDEQAYEAVKATLKAERIQPFKRDELEAVRSVEGCINCGLCIGHCPVVRAVGVERFSGPRSIAVELSRSPPEFWTTSDKVYLCTGCGTCREVCPRKVNIPAVVNMIRTRIFAQRPDLVPKALLDEHDVIVKHSLAFEPWADQEEKSESRKVRLETLGLPSVPDRVVPDADVLFYPGCQAEERAQEVKEAAKYILSYFGINYTLLDQMSCCGLPSKLIGDDETARLLAGRLQDKVKSLGVKKIVTTCAGCTSNLCDISARDGWGIPVYHLIEFLAEEIGFNKVSRPFKGRGRFTPAKVTIHDPCHIIRHTSRQIAEHARAILNLIPGVTIEESGMSDSCCGGGGMVGYHSRDVADAVVTENVAAISSTEADTVVTPCPLCTAQIESNLFRAGSQTVVEDLTVFFARRLPQKR